MMRRILSIVCFLALAAGCQRGADPVPASQPVVGKPLPDLSKPVAGDRFYFDDCPQCGAMLGTRGDAVERSYKGRQVRFCQQKCVDAFEASFAASLAKLDATMIADQKAYYPLETCVVSGEKLGTRPIEFISLNRMVRVADTDAHSAFEADPKSYWSALDDAAIAKHAAGYAVTKCPVQGVKLEGPADGMTTVVIANRLVRTCCRDCARLVRAKPSHYLPLIDSAHRMLKPIAKPGGAPSGG